jgi:diguanylate cyclase (GGDEF)-like protein/PAS domain S-box-containing protein
VKLDDEPEVMDVSALRMREATITAALWMSVGVGLLGGLYAALTWQRPHRGELLVLFVLAILTAIVVYFLPREKIVRSRIREPFFLIWTLSDFAMLVVGTLADGGTASPLVVVFFLPVVFSSMSYPLASVAIVGVASVSSFLTVALIAGGSSPAFQLGFAFALLCTAAMSAWQAQNHNRQHAALSRASRTDPLTGCLNRRGFQERAIAEIAELTRQGGHGAVVALDIDHFKPVNDTFGHAAGDELLCWFARTLEAAVRPGDAVGRLGGDEFAVLLADVEPSEVQASAARLEAALGSRAPASLGIAVFPDDGVELEALSRCADARLYASRRGRTGSSSSQPAREAIRAAGPVQGVAEQARRFAPTDLWRAALEAMPRSTRDAQPIEEPDLQDSLLEQIDASVIGTDLQGNVISWNSGAEALYGWTEEEALGRSSRDLIVPEDAQAAERLGEEVLREGRWDGELLVRHKDGSLFTVYVRNRLVRDAAGIPTAIVGVAVDISARVAAETELLQSRNYAQAVTEFMGEGLLTLDVEGRVTYVNRAAEALIGWTSGELRGRLIGELLGAPDPDGPPQPFGETPIAEAIARDTTIRVEDDTFTTGGGRGLPVAYTATPFHTDDGLRGCIVLFQDITERRVREEEHRRDAETLAIIDRVESALLDERFVMHAQPIIDLRSGEVIQHELLLRMSEPDGRLAAPGEFLPVAERYALIGEIDWWVIKQATELAGSGCPVQLNLSARSVGDPDVLEHIERCIEQWKVPPGKIVVEITETAIVEDQQAARAFAEGLHDLGCEIALDDFGTGYGTLTYLKQIPVDYLKLDIEFVRDLASNSASRHVVDAILTLARNFQLRTVAEGVEDAETLALLSGLGVDFAQGFHIAHPAAFSRKPGDLQGPPAVDLSGLTGRLPARRPVRSHLAPGSERKSATTGRRKRTTPR